MVKEFLSEEDKHRIIDSVKEAECCTTGEIVPMVVSASYHYPMADVIGATLFAFTLSIFMTPLVGGFFWIGAQNMWVFIGLFAVKFTLFHTLIRRIPSLKRVFVSKKEIDEEVEEAAITSFFKQNICRTRDATGVLIYISLFEHKVYVLADKGINAMVAQGEWDEIVKLIVDGIRQKRGGEVISEAVRRVGIILKEYFPAKPDDKDELDNLIVKT
ncbi:MAG: hypothetical protein V1753_06400 [Pseudomonadota bacterium]